MYKHISFVVRNLSLNVDKRTDATRIIIKLACIANGHVWMVDVDVSGSGSFEHLQTNT
jgi:hypothetical protein